MQTGQHANPDIILEKCHLTSFRVYNQNLKISNRNEPNLICARLISVIFIIITATIENIPSKFSYGMI